MIEPIKRRIVTPIKRKLREIQDIDKYTMQLSSADPRTVSSDNIAGDVRSVGTRVRWLTTTDPAFGSTKRYVLKRTHGYGNAEMDARDVISTIRGLVVKHNLLYPKDNYFVVMPKAYAISRRLLLTTYLEEPTISEILRDSTYNGRSAKETLIKARRYSAFLDAVRKLTTRTNLQQHNYFYLGMKKGRFVFMPLVDVE